MNGKDNGKTIPNKNKIVNYNMTMGKFNVIKVVPDGVVAPILIICGIITYVVFP